MNQPSGLPPRSIRIEVPAGALLALGERLAPVMHAYVEEVLSGLEGDRHRIAATALQAYVGRFTALSNMRVDGAASVESQLPSFALGWAWGATEFARMQGAANESSVIVPSGAA